MDLDLRDWLHDEWATRNRARSLEKRVARLRRTNRRLGARVEALESSTRMRLGTALVRPLAAVRRRVGRR